MTGWNKTSLAALLIAIGLITPAVTFVGLHSVTPFDGARFQPGEVVLSPNGLLVTPLEERSDGLLRGDEVIAVEGRSMESWARALFEVGAPRPRWQVGQTIVYTVVRGDQQKDIQIKLTNYPLNIILANEWGTILFAVVSQFVATFVFLRRPNDSAARALLFWASGILSATTWSLGLQISDVIGGIGFWLYKATSFGSYMVFWSAGLHFALIFPNAHPFVLRHSWIIRAVYVTPFVVYPLYLAAIFPTAINTLDWLGRWGVGETALAAVYLALIMIMAVGNYSANHDPLSRQKIRWVVFAAVLSGGGSLLVWILPSLILGYSIISTNFLGLLVLPFPLTIAIAIMRHHLFDIDVVLNRTLVYGTLTASTIGIYIFIVGYIGTLFQDQDRSLLAFLATGLVAVIFQPLRERLQRGINRLMYGERDDPYAVLSRLGQRLEATLAPEAVLPTIVETVAQALKLSCAAIALKEENGFKIVAISPAQPSASVTPIQTQSAAGEILPLIYQGEVVGQFIFSPRAPGESFTVGERRLLEDIAHQAGVAVHAVRLTADLQRSRERLVTAREEERRRLRRDLHDGLGPHLASQSFKLEAARDSIRHNPDKTEALLTDLISKTQNTISDVRRLVYALRPPALDELGLIAAVREHAAQCELNGVRITVAAPDQLPSLPAAVEVATYRIIQEALTNVMRHAQAQTCAVSIELKKGTLNLQISDDGIGLSRDHHRGVGLNSMRERAEELGGQCVIEPAPKGGTRVKAELPLR
ncbi:MAG: hypothetical protein HZB77_12070 [Chloroflexi bacterium]|nr:hypothetical protein [Chloroflexota bacterium]